MRIGRSVSSILIASAAALALSGAAANADVLYQNPDPISSSLGNVDSFLINHGFSVSDSFLLGSNSNLSSIDFVSWNTPGDHITSVDWTISTDAGDVGGAGTSLGGGTATVTDALLTAGNFPGFDLMLNNFNLNLDLSAGTYWLTLQNAFVNGVGGDFAEGVFWDQGGGISQAWLNNIGPITVENDCGGFGGPPDTTGTPDSCAETFRINGTASTSIPEPITVSLFGAGLVGAVALRRRKKQGAQSCVR